jgi:periplasmic copper chaperone A
MRRCAVALTVVASLWAVQAASAHVTASPAELNTGFTFTEFSVPHGCDGSPTTKLTIQIPAGIAGVKPQEVAGWRISTKEGTLPQPVDEFGEQITEGVTEVSWTGGPLPDSHLQQFGMSFFASETLAGQTVYWKAIQQCEEGVTRWIEIPVEGEEPPPEPAPAIAFLASAEGEEGGGAGETTAAGEDEAAAAPTGSSDGDGNGLAIVALIVGIAGLAAGLGALFLAWNRSPSRASTTRT